MNLQTPAVLFALEQLVSGLFSFAVKINRLKSPNNISAKQKLFHGRQHVQVFSQGRQLRPNILWHYFSSFLWDYAMWRYDWSSQLCTQLNKCDDRSCIHIFRRCCFTYSLVLCNVPIRLNLVKHLTLRWLTTVLMEYKSTTFNSFEKSSKLFFPSVFTVCLSLLPFYAKFEQLNVNKWPTEYPMRDWAPVG